MIETVKEIIAHSENLEQQLASPEVASNPREMERLGREYNQLRKNMPVFHAYLDAAEKLSQAKTLLGTETDPEMIEMVRQEIAENESKLESLSEKTQRLLIPLDPDDLKNAIMEIRAGTGGTEAGIFGGDLYRMYTRYAERKGWAIEVLSISEGEKFAIKEVIFMVSGNGAYGILKYESGVHRVQRVPDTETQGRIHTSAATVVVLPEADDLDVSINPEDLRIDVYRASGAGGQHVNKTESAVRITHLPTNLVVTCQDEKSQHKNKARALKVLQSRLLDLRKSEANEKEKETRRSMVSTGDRSAKIRTYNYPQARLTDHRINLTIYNLPAIIDGDLDEVTEALSIADTNEKLQNLNIAR